MDLTLKKIKRIWEAESDDRSIESTKDWDTAQWNSTSVLSIFCEHLMPSSFLIGLLDST